MKTKRKAFVVAALEVFGVDKDTITRPEIQAVLEENPNLTFPQWVVGTDFRTDKRGVYHLPNENGRYLLGKDVKVETLVTPEAAAAAPVALATGVGVMENHEGYTPEKFNGYVPWGNFNMVRDVLKSGNFYPLFITCLLYTSPSPRD